MKTQPSRRSSAAAKPRHLLVLSWLCLAAGALGCPSLPPLRSAPAAEPPAPPSRSAPTPSQGELRLTLAAGRYVRVAILASPGDLAVRQVGPDGSLLEELRLAGGGIEPTLLSWLVEAPGDYRWTVEPRDSARPSASRAIWLDEERPAGPCDGARRRAERALLAGRRELDQPGEEAAATAAGHFTSALADWQEDGEADGRAATLLAAADAELRSAHLSAADELCARALVLARQLGDRRTEARALQIRAQLTGAADQLSSLTSALALQQGRGDEVALAFTLFRLGLYYNEQGDGAGALVKLRRALELQLRNQDTRDAAGTLREMGVAYRFLDDAAHARLYLDLGLEFSVASGDRIAEANARRQSADLHLQNSELQAAYEETNHALRLLLAAGERKDAAYAQVAVADSLLHLGEPEKAREGYLEALAGFEALRDPQGRASALLGVGQAFAATGDFTSAIASFERALVLIRAVGLPSWEALALYDLGKAHRELDQPAAAIPQLERALELEAGDNPARGAQILVELGNAHHKRGNLEASERAFKRAISLKPGRLVEAAAQAGLARIERERGDLAAARSAIGRALDITETIRSEVIREDQRISFLASRRAYYDFDVDLLMRMERRHPGAGYGAAALAASEQARARSLLDLLVEDRSEVRQGHRQATDAAFRGSAPLPLPEIQGLLDEDTALLEFFLGSEGSYLFVVTRHGFATHPLPAQQVLKPLVDSLHAAVYQVSRLASRHFADDASALYSRLLLPAAGELADKRRLIVVPDGCLFSLSFEVLLTKSVPGASGPQRGLPYLIRKQSVSYVPSVSVLAFLLRERLGGRDDRSRGKLFVGFADPRNRPGGGAAPDGGCDPARSTGSIRGGNVQASLQEGLDGLPPLPAARDEVCRIASLFPAAEAVTFVGPDATEENVKGGTIVASARNLHFAVHGQLDEAHPDRSGLDLAHSGAAEDGLLQVREIMNLELHADLVVLSACASGLGKAVSGEGLIGMTRAFLYAGAASLVVSLWRVDDESTAELMVRFYDYLRQTADKSEALRRAKLELIDGDYDNPYYWAPFVLVGLPH